MPIVYEIRKTQYSPEVFVGVRQYPPAIADVAVREVFTFMAGSGYDFDSADIVQVFAESLRNRFQANNDANFAMILDNEEGPWELRVRVLLGVRGENQLPAVSGEILTAVSEGEPYRGAIGESVPDGVEMRWLPFAFA